MRGSLRKKPSKGAVPHATEENEVGSTPVSQYGYTVNALGQRTNVSLSGNVSEYLDSTGNDVAHYEYAPFGKLTVSTGSKAAEFSHRFSTKPLDTETGLYYYGYRYYDPITGRWPSRDPIGEKGGINLYGFVGNDGVNQWDYLGHQGCFGQTCDGGRVYTPPDTSDGLSYCEGSGHYFNGGGSSLTVDFSSVDPGWGFYDFPAKSVPRTYGDHPYASSKVIELLWDGKGGNGGPGQINIILEGTITVFCEKSTGKDKWKFEGKVYAEPNRFDFNKGDRGFPREGITTIIRNCGPAFGGEDFTVNFSGDRNVKEEDYAD